MIVNQALAENQRRQEENQREVENIDQNIQRVDELLPLRERIKNTFKEYGFTAYAVLSAVSAVLGVILSSLTVVYRH